MGKMLLQDLSETEPNETNAAVKGVDDNKALSELMKEMKSHLEEASKELLQPRKETLDKLLKKALR